MFKNILLATDGSPASSEAISLAVDLARVHEARLTALYVVDPYPYLNVGEASPLGLQAYMSAAHAHAERAHAKVKSLCRTGADLQVRTLEDTHAAVGIVKAAEELEADLIVVGSHGRTGIPRMLLGSVAARVVAEAQVPVLVARAKGGQ